MQLRRTPQLGDNATMPGAKPSESVIRIIVCPDCGHHVRRQGVQPEPVASALFWHRLGWNGACGAR